jgi:micrococcal nuclease
MTLRILALLILLTATGCRGDDGETVDGTVGRVLDGDTIVLAGGRHVRLVQLDAPEMDASECYAREATRTLARLIPPGTDIELESDPVLDRIDVHGRLLAYVLRDGENVNVDLVEQGAAAPWFYEGARGRHADDLLAAAGRAKQASRGLWSACPGTALDALHAVEARR